MGGEKERERWKDMQQKVTGWNRTRGAAARTQLLHMGHPLNQRSYQDTPMHLSIEYTFDFAQAWYPYDLFMGHKFP